MPASYGTSTVEDLALSSLPSKNNCWGSSLQTASNPLELSQPRKGCDLSASLAPQPGQPEVSCMRLRLLLTATRGRAICWPFGEVVPVPSPGRMPWLLTPGQKSCFL